MTTSTSSITVTLASLLELQGFTIVQNDKTHRTWISYKPDHLSAAMVIDHRTQDDKYVTDHILINKFDLKFYRDNPYQLNYAIRLEGVLILTSDDQTPVCDLVLKNDYHMAATLASQGYSRLSLPQKESHLAALSLTDSTLESWSAPDRNSDKTPHIELTDTTVNRILIKSLSRFSCETSTIINTTIEHPRLKMSHTYCDGVCFGSKDIDILDRIHQCDFDFNDHDEDIIEEHNRTLITPTDLPTAGEIKNLYGATMDALTYRDGGTIYVKMGCYHDTLDKFIAMIERDVATWPSFNASEPPSSEQIEAAKARYRDWYQMVQKNYS